MIGANAFDFWHLALFLTAAGALALMPGPGIFYVTARTLAGGRGEGIASSFGTGLGGFAHVIAGAAGVSALVMASAEAFTVLKFVGTLYLVYLGIKTWRQAGRDAAQAALLGREPAIGARRASRKAPSSRRSTRRRRRSSSPSCRSSWCSMPAMSRCNSSCWGRSPWR